MSSLKVRSVRSSEQRTLRTSRPGPSILMPSMHGVRRVSMSLMMPMARRRSASIRLFPLEMPVPM